MQKALIKVRGVYSFQSREYRYILLVNPTQNGGILLTHLQANSEVLKKRFPHVLNKITQTQQGGENGDSEFSEGFDKDINWLKAVEGLMGTCKIVFVYGFERGLSIADVIEEYPDRWLFVYEPNVSLFRKAMNEYDLSLLLEHPNFYFFALGESQLKMLFNMVCSYMQQEMVFIAQRKYLEHDHSELQKVKKQFDEYRSTFYSNKYTEHHFREEWTRNYFYHLSDALDSPFIEEMTYLCEGSTAIIVSSGPSLQEDIEWIRKLRNHAIIIAAGSSIQALVKNGIQPHFAVIMDGHPVNNKIFSAPEMLEAPLVFTTSSYYEIADRKKENKIYSIMKTDAVSLHYFGMSSDQILMTPAATVAGNAIQVAAILGAKRILLAGQDLSFSNNQFYTQGIGHFAADFTDQKVKEAHQTVLNVKGGYNLTEDGFLFMKDALESLMASLTEIEFINISRHGAVIEGAPFQPIEELYDEIAGRSLDPELFTKWLSDNRKTVSSETADRLKQRLAEQLADFAKVNEEIRMIKRQIDKLGEWSRTKPFKAQQSMEEIERMWGEIANRPWFSAVFETIIPLQVARFDQSLPEIVTERNLVEKAALLHKHLGKLFEEIKKAIPVLEDIVSESMIRVESKMSANTDLR